MHIYVYIIKIWYLLVSNSIVGEFPVQSGCTLWLAPGWRDPGGDGIRMWKMDENGDWLKHILCILTHINVTENIGTSLEFTYKYWKMTMEIDRPWNNGNNRTSRKNLWKVEFPLWRKRWYSKKHDNNDNFCCSIGFFVDYIDCVFFPIVKAAHSNWHLLTLCGWCIDDCELTHWIRWSFWKRKFEKLRRLRTCRCDSKIHRYPPVSWLILQTEILPVRQELFFRSWGHLTLW